MTNDKRITELDEVTSPVSGDVLPIVNANITKKIDWSNLGFMLLAGIYGGIHVHDSAVAQTIPTGATYTKLTCYTDNSTSNNMTPDAANDKVTITTAGVYLIACSCSFADDTNNVTWFVSPHLGDVEIDSIHFTRKIGTAGDVGSASMSGILSVSSVPVDLDIRVRHDNLVDVDITVSYSNLSLAYIGSI